MVCALLTRHFGSQNLMLRGGHLLPRSHSSFPALVPFRVGGISQPHQPSPKPCHFSFPMFPDVYLHRLSEQLEVLQSFQQLLWAVVLGEASLSFKI